MLISIINAVDQHGECYEVIYSSIPQAINSSIVSIHPPEIEGGGATKWLRVCKVRLDH